MSEEHRVVAPAGTSTVTLAPLRGGGRRNRRATRGRRHPDGGVYTVEARRRAGYDVGVPADAVIIHHVRGAVGRAYLVDADGNVNAGDEGTVWRVGEVFRDRARGVEIAVDRAVGDGFQVTLRTPAVDSARVLPGGHRRTVPSAPRAHTSTPPSCASSGPTPARRAGSGGDGQTAVETRAGWGAGGSAGAAAPKGCRPASTSSTWTYACRASLPACWRWSTPSS
jgi:hypothetical protein